MPAGLKNSLTGEPVVFNGIRNRIMEARLEANINRRELARRIGVAENTILNIEAGKKVPSLKTTLRIAEVLDVIVEDLVEEVDE